MQQIVTEFIKDLASKYQLSIENVKDIVERTLLNILKKTSKVYTDFDVYFSINKAEFEIWAYRDTGPNVYVKKININNFKSNTIRFFKNRLFYEIHKELSIAKYSQLRPKTGTVIYGYIRNQVADDLIIEENGTGNLGRCIKRHQPIPERKKYVAGKIYPFYVLKTEIYEIKGVYSVILGLSRTTWNLPVVLLKNEIVSDGLNIEIKPIKRIPGYYTECLANQKVPKEKILAVSKELNERIIVKYSQEKTLI